MSALIYPSCIYAIGLKNRYFLCQKCQVLFTMLCYYVDIKRRYILLKELNLVIDYIEDHLTDERSLEKVAEYAGVSDYHLKMVFFYLSGLTLSEYIKNRKLSE